MTAGIYLIWNEANARVYVGSALNIERRWSEHRHLLEHGYHTNSRLQVDWREHGASEFSFEIVEQIPTRDSQALAEPEQRWLDSFDLETAYHRRTKIHRPSTHRELAEALGVQPLELVGEQS